MATTGLDLKVKRVRARVSLKQLVDAYGKSRTTLWMIERETGAVDPNVVAKYLEALETCRNVTVESGGTAA